MIALRHGAALSLLCLMLPPLIALNQAGATDISTVPLSTYSASTSTDVKPNIMFVLDDSGSMDWDYMPDWANDNSPPDWRLKNANFNGLAYNPAVTYTPPVSIDSTGAISTSVYLSMTGSSAATGANTASALPNWKSVKNDAYGVQSTSRTDLTPGTSNAPVFYTTIPGEYCTSTSLRVCQAATAPSASYPYPAYLRWCNSTTLTNCKAGYDNTYNKPRMPILTGSGYTGSPGQIIQTTLTSGNNSYPYPGSASKAASRTDCAASTCTYAEEMTNYANWFTYYRTRMQMMKTAASKAFSSIDAAEDLRLNNSRFRIGFMTLNNNQNTDFVNPADFKGNQKFVWFSKLFNANPGNFTPLRRALSDVGRLYAGKLNGQQFNGVSVTDPLQYSCQQNYTLLSTDGFWNSGAGYKLDGVTSVGNQDSGMPAPYGDGGTSQIQTRTSDLQTATVTNPYQIRTSKLQTRTFRNGSWSSWSDTSSCTTASGVECRYTSWSNWSQTSACTAVPKTAASPYTVAVATECQTAGGTVGTYSNATATCTASVTVRCQYSSWTAWSNVSSCTAVAPSTASPYSVLKARECQTTSSSGTSDTLADVAAYYYKTDLRSTVSADNTGTCVGPIIAPATTPNNLCTNNVATTEKDPLNTQHMTTFTLGLGAQGQMIYAPNDGVNYWNDTIGDFFDVKNRSTPNSSTGICSWQSSGQCVWPTPSSDSIANIDDLWHAAINGHGTYFSARDPISLGTSLAGALTTISKQPRPGTAAAAASSNPNVSSSDNYVFSSSYQSMTWYGEFVRQQISNTGVLSAQNWSAMRFLDCATTPWRANTNYIAGNVFRYGSLCYAVTTDYASGASFQASTGGLDQQNTSVLNADEAAVVKVPAVALSSRTIYTKPASGTTLLPFLWSNLSSAGLVSTFAKSFLATPAASPRLSQFCASGDTCLSDADQTSASGENLVNFLRGERSYEGSYYRQRLHVLGDIVSSEARYVKVPLFNYVDPGYSGFKALMNIGDAANSIAARKGMAYVGANDGMLHAFEAETGQELWAYVPGFVLPNLYQLADKKYSDQHQFFVDNTPEVGEFCSAASSASDCAASDWKTILVGGLGRGGKGYYALDITSPDNPKLMWEFTDSSMGYSYGNPRITKLKDGTWVVLLTSGYNTPDGKGYLYVLNAASGQLIRTIATQTSGEIARISAHAISGDTNNTTVAVYGGDTQGNLWRFDINGDIGTNGYEAHRLASLVGPDGLAQPITAKPTVSTLNGSTIVYVGTGRYLGVSDITDTAYQSFYAIADRSNTSTFNNLRNDSSFIQQALTSSVCNTSSNLCTVGQTIRTITSNAVDLSTQNGWYLDFLTAGERANTDASLGLGTVVFTTNVPSAPTANACGDPNASGSKSFIYALDYATGAAVQNAENIVGVSLGDGIVTRPVLVALSDGTVRSLTRVSNGVSNDTDLGSTSIKTPPIHIGSAAGLRRVSWRELTVR